MAQLYGDALRPVLDPRAFFGGGYGAGPTVWPMPPRADQREGTGRPGVRKRQRPANSVCAAARDDRSLTNGL
jgi:hypothetical protein